jgi:general stress protein 26
VPVNIRHNNNAKKFLRSHPVGVLATVGHDHRPHAAAIYFTVDSQFNIKFITKSETRKAANLLQHIHAMLVVYEPESQTTVQVTGDVSKVEDTTEVNRIFTEIIYTSLDVSNTDIPPPTRLSTGEYLAFSMKPTEIRMAVFTKPKFGDYNEIFKTILPEKE